MAEEQVTQSGFVNDSKQVLLDPAGYFTSLKLDAGLGKAVIKALLYGLIAGIIYFIWGVLGIGMAGKFGGIMAIIGYPIGAIIGLFIGGIILFIISAISKGNTDFGAVLQVTASLMVLMPVNAFLGVLGLLGVLVVTLASLLVSLYGLYLLFTALKLSLKADENTAKIVIVVLAILVVFTSYSGYKAQQFLKEFQQNMPK